MGNLAAVVQRLQEQKQAEEKEESDSNFNKASVANLNRVREDDRQECATLNAKVPERFLRTPSPVIMRAEETNPFMFEKVPKPCSSWSCDQTTPPKKSEKVIRLLSRQDSMCQSEEAVVQPDAVDQTDNAVKQTPDDDHEIPVDETVKKCGVKEVVVPVRVKVLQRNLKVGEHIQQSFELEEVGQ
jgi:hypothetical protein